MAPSADREKAGEPSKPRRRPGRVPVSCAECRRLKLRCDRKVPCETCTKRGCAAICPNGSLATGKANNNKYVLANTEELHARIERMTRRIRELEHGLGSLQSTISDTPHPLLGEDRMDSEGLPATPVRTSNPESVPEPVEEEVIDSLGTLSIGPRGDTTFYGATARGEYLLQAARTAPVRSFFECTRLHERILSVPFPEAASNVDDEVRQMVIGHLPSLDEARALCDLFMVNATYLSSSVTRAELDAALETVYFSKATPDGVPASHLLGLLFVIMAIAKLFTTGANYSVDAHDYFVLSRVSLTFDSPIITTTVTSVQTMVRELEQSAHHGVADRLQCYMAQYLEMSDVSLIPTGCAKAWMYLGLAMKMAHSIGLHLKSARFRLSEAESERRSRVFWHLFTIDSWSSFTFGRPPSTAMNFIDSDLPKDEGHQLSDGTSAKSFPNWSYLFVQLLHQVMTTAFSAKLPQYSTILDLDRKLRDFHVPDYLRPQPSNASDPPSSFLDLKRWLVLSNKEWALLNIHRAYFAQAMRERPIDPLKHKYGLSVMALYRSAYRLVECCRSTMMTAPTIFFRSNLACSKVLSAAIVLCLLVCSAPASNLAAPALEVLDRACEIFQHDVELGSLLASENADAVRNLHRQAHEAMDKNEVPGRSPLSSDELDRLCGKTRVVTCAPSPAVDDQILSDYRALCGVSVSLSVSPSIPSFAFADVPSTSTSQYASSAGPAYPPQPRVQPQSQPMQEVSLTGVGSSMRSGSQTFQGAPPGFEFGQNGQGPYILDASWQDFAQQLGF
ncbi:hypothetical protein BV25DRAFT_1988290 [Artomyces pyxidatus]|uniref:Uncharacterized protein n=1 Tax=Artomyces pyxidatus TaxID=48021 RepID=A0ACB8TDN6_9AGAM|nr:hypothetical protein BV25DRAFT_1988290 [Artomyces pyxidatus]